MPKEYILLKKTLKDILAQVGCLAQSIHDSIGIKDFVSAKLILNTNFDVLIDPDDQRKLLSHMVKYDEMMDSLEHLLTSDNINKAIYNKGDTLLSIASLYGAKKVVEFLVQHGANTNMPNILAQTPIFSAVYSNNFEIVKYLIDNSSIELNIKDAEGRCPLHYAALIINPKLGKYLISKGANPDIENNTGLNYDQLLKYSRMLPSKREKPASYYDIKLSENATFQIEGFNKLYRAVFEQNTNKVQKNLFCEAKKYFMDFVKKSISVQNLSNSDKDLAKFFLVLLETIFFDYEQAAQPVLEDFIVNSLEKLELFENLVLFYNNFYGFSISNQDYSASAKYAKLRLDTLDRHALKISDKIKYSIYYQEGVWNQHRDIKKSIECLDKAQRFSSNTFEDQEAIALKVMLIINKMRDFDQAYKIASRIQDVDLRDLLLTKLEIDVNVNSSVIDISNKYNFTRFTKDSIFATGSYNKIEIYENINNSFLSRDNKYDQFLTKPLLQEFVENQEWPDQNTCFFNFNTSMLFEIPIKLYKLLYVYTISDNFIDGLRCLEEYYTKYPKIMKENDYLPLKFQEFIILENNNCFVRSDMVLESLYNLGMHIDYVCNEVSRCLAYRISCAIADKDFSKIQYYINLANTPERVNNKLPEKVKKLLQFAEILQKQYYEELSNPITINSPEVPSFEAKVLKLNIEGIEQSQHGKDEISENIDFVNIDLSEFTSEIENTTDLQVPTKVESNIGKTINNYFKQIKKYLQNLQIDNDFYSWNTEKGLYNLKTQNVVKFFEGSVGNYYAVILPKLLKDLGDNSIVLIDMFRNALAKGLVKRSEGSNGIKYIPGKLYELKINEDTRLVAETIYKNDKNQYLIIFDKKCNHSEVKKYAEKNKLKITECQSFCFSDESTHENDFTEQTLQNSHLIKMEILGNDNEELYSEL